jgi:gamma-glutamylputrescine oxidase
MISYLYCQALKDVLLTQGVKTFEGTEALGIEETTVHTEFGQVQAKNVVICSDYKLEELENDAGHEVYHAQTFLGITRKLPEELVKNMFPESKLMVWDTDLIYQYFRVIGGNRLLLGGSNLLYTYQPNVAESVTSVRRKLQTYLHHNFPEFEKIDLEYIWPGLIGVSKDFLPLAGQSKLNNNVFYISGAAGLPWAAALGQYIAQKVLTGRDELDNYFSASRKFVLGAKTQSMLQKPITFALAHGYEKFVK